MSRGRTPKPSSPPPGSWADIRELAEEKLRAAKRRVWQLEEVLRALGEAEKLGTPCPEEILRESAKPRMWRTAP